MKRRLQTILPLVLLITSLGCERPEQIFRRLNATQTGIDFNNLIQEDERYNVYNFMNIYTGAGVATGDINNDGLMDLYFSGNIATGRIYLNQGNLHFQDITETSGVQNSRWGTGATMIDINQDGWLDIYVAVSGSDEPQQRANLLYINQGDNTFQEKASDYGIDDERQTQHSAFFDYDKDGDLDLFLIINPAAYERKVNVVQPRKLQGEGVSTDVLYRNNGNGTFTDVSQEAGILVEGYSLGLGISDINNDGWPDIYISNDFVGNDVLYINNGDGTFSDKAPELLAHTSYAGMGNDVSDFNNDGLADIMVLDMRPEDNYRQKLIISSTSYDRFQLMLGSGYQPQYSRNTLQLNRGNGHFSEVGFMSGVSSTDWSWGALFGDYDNDGDKDLFVTNGFLRDLGNLDYIHYQNIYDTPLGDPQVKVQNKLDDIKSLEGADIHDYLYENSGGIEFRDRSRAWGIKHAGFSNGAVYVDLDNDGDLELVVNNVNEPAHFYENRAIQLLGTKYLTIELLGAPYNKRGIGAKIRLTHQGKLQHYENFISRGYESSVDPRPHFGLDSISRVDSVEIWWPDGKYQLLEQVETNQMLTLKYEDAVSFNKLSQTKSPIFKNVTDTYGINYLHKENSQVDFNVQPILPKMHSQEGPGIAVGDVNSDGLEDFYTGGAAGSSGTLHLQQAEDSSSTFRPQFWPHDSLSEDMGTLFFDAELDGDLDLYVVSGGTAYPKNSSSYQDRLYLNDGQGNFSLSDGLPALNSSGSSVVGADYDRDGDIDLFVGGRVVPGEYPLTPESYLLRNDSQIDGQVRFTDVTDLTAGLKHVGMVTSALWTDYDDNGWFDLMLVGEFMPVTVFANEAGVLKANVLKDLIDTEGWWNGLTAGDFDNDGDTDYIAGNLGTNTKYAASIEEPLCIYAKDFDKNGRLDPVMCQYIDGVNQITHTRDDLIKQISAMRARFKTYEEYASTSFDRSFLKEELQDAYVVQAKEFRSTYLENMGEGRFVLSHLPWEAQLTPIYGMLVYDYNTDGYLDVLLLGNSFSTEVSTGRYDAGLGLLLQNNRIGGWQPISPDQSGMDNQKDAKGVALLHQAMGGLVLVGNNSDKCGAYGFDQIKHHPAKALDATVHSSLSDGKKRKTELYYGSTYLSHSSRMIPILGQSQVQVLTYGGKSRNIKTDK